MDEDRYYNLGSHDKLFNQIDELTDALASRDAEIESLRQQLLDTKSVLDQAMTTVDDLQKSNVMLRDALEYHQAQTRPIQRTEEALAATDDLDGLILCDAVEVGWIGTGPRDGRCEFSESKPANCVMRDFNMKPLYAQKRLTK